MPSQTPKPYAPRAMICLTMNKKRVFPTMRRINDMLRTLTIYNQTKSNKYFLHSTKRTAFAYMLYTLFRR